MRFYLIDQRNDLIVAIDALTFRRLIKLPRIIVRLAVVTRRELMQFEIVMERLEDAANDSRKPCGSDCIADD